jgi:H/ACA ribonucleoprotein complex subunit 3
VRSLLLKCSECGSYTMKEACPRCGKLTVTVHPARYSPDDKYARYRNPRVYEESA